VQNIPHIPVLKDEVVESFYGCSEGYLIDCTIGYAGHSSAIMEAYPDISVIGIDRDDEALEFSNSRLKRYGDRYTLLKGSFAEKILEIKQKPIVGILADFGVSSLQLDKPERGFSFDSDLLDMRMDQGSSLTAYDIINSYSKDRLEYIFGSYGEISQAAKLADMITKARSKAPIKSAKELSRIAKTTLSSKNKIHPATLLFQAVRIEVNDELGQIEGLLDALEKMRPASATVSLITFHSLEDRIVKQRFKKWTKDCICDENAPRCACGKKHSLGKIATKKPITATKYELKLNPRSRSAKLRSFRFKGEEL